MQYENFNRKSYREKQQQIWISKAFFQNVHLEIDNQGRLIFGSIRYKLNGVNEHSTTFHSETRSVGYN